MSKSNSLRDSHIPKSVLGGDFEIESAPEYNEVFMGIGDLPFQTGQVESFDLTGLNQECGDSVNLDNLLQASVTDLSWLELAEQDPERLPQDSHSIVPELEELWRTASTDHFTLESNTIDLDSVRYQESLDGDVFKPSIDTNTYETIVSKAMRRSAKGEHLDTIVEDLLLQAGESVHTFKRAVECLRNEHGLVGNVYIRKSAFPNYDSGKWNDFIRKNFKEAQYIIVSKEDLNRSYIIDGRCTYSGKKAVLQVPWKEAYSYYTPRLVATGYKLASGDYKTTLKTAFISGPLEEVQTESYKPVQKDITEGVDSKQARSDLQEYTPEDVTGRLANDLDKREYAKQQKFVQERITKMVQAGLIPTDEGLVLLQSTDHPQDILKAATFISTRVKSGTYSGQGSNTESNVALSELRLQRWESSFSSIKDSVDKRKAQELYESSTEARYNKVISKYAKVVQQEINRGVTGSVLSDYISRSVPQELAQDVLSKITGLKEALATQPKEDVVYSDAVYTQHSPVHTPKQASMFPKTGSAWLRRTMTEGFSGKNLDELIQHKFTDQVLAAGQQVISTVRQEHEGASGFLYVDVEAYNHNNKQGCEDGALKHRTNNIPAVKGMDKCGSCVHNKKLADGTPVCGLFKKTILMDTQIPDTLKRQNIQNAEMDDFEVTASLFQSVDAPTYNPTEFGLHNANLDEIDITGITKDDKLASILFDGWIID